MAAGQLMNAIKAAFDFRMSLPLRYDDPKQTFQISCFRPIPFLKIHFGLFRLNLVKPIKAVHRGKAIFYTAIIASVCIDAFEALLFAHFKQKSVVMCFLIPIVMFAFRQPTHPEISLNFLPCLSCALWFQYLNTV